MAQYGDDTFDPLATDADLQQVVGTALRPEWNWLLRQVEREIVGKLDLNQVLMLTIDATLRATGAHEVVVALTEPPDLMRVVQTFGEHYTLGVFPLKLHQGIVGRAILTRQPIFVQDVATDPDYIPFVSDTRAQMVLPILWRGDLLGILNIETHDPSRFTGEAFQFLKMFIDRVALALDNAHTHQTVQRQVNEMRDLYERVHGLERMKSTLIDVAAHDLRNPVGAIRNMSQMILEENDLSAEQQRMMIQSILNASNDALRIIDDLMVLQRIENSNRDATFRAIDIALLVLAVIEKKKASEAFQDHHLEVILPDTGVNILGEPALLREAISNLIDNAIKYTPNGGKITISLMTAPETVCICFIDTGYGIEPEELPLIFQPFYRAPSGISRGILGTGLGLHIVNQIMEQHGGSITVCSTAAEGSTFTMKLPLLSILKRE